MIEVGASYLRIVRVGTIFATYTAINASAFQGARHIFHPLATSHVANIPCQLALASLLALPPELGICGIWIAIAASVVAGVGIFARHFRGREWQERSPC